MVLDDTGSVEGMHAFIYCTKWRSGEVLPMPDSLTHSQTLKDRATQLLKKYKSGALVTQCLDTDDYEHGIETVGLQFTNILRWMLSREPAPF